ncbi:DNA/RNA non-specific endonuclease [Stackebrandtia soli]|uniref:DNA/RNA non-specific endonuclease n=1 Tax=Stackebrandtia soli TaxID=1892856 RepID=UPI0039EC3ABD
MAYGIPGQSPHSRGNRRWPARAVVITTVLITTGTIIAVVPAMLPAAEATMSESNLRDWRARTRTTSAVFGLVSAPATHLSANLDTGGRELAVDASVSNLGTLNATVSGTGFDAELLQTGEYTFVKAPASFWSDEGFTRDEATQFDGTWTRTDPDVFGVNLAEALDPTTIAMDVDRSVLEGRATPGGSGMVDGVTADVVHLGDDRTLYLSTSESPSLLRLEEPGNTIDFESLDQDAVEELFEQITDLIEGLDTAVDSQVRFALDGDIVLSPCNQTTCTAKLSLSNTVSTTSRYVKVDAPVHASVTIDMSLDGRPIKTCVKNLTMKPNGTGNVTCTASYTLPNPPPGQTRYHEVVARSTTVARAVAKADIAQLIKDVLEEAERLVKIYDQTGVKPNSPNVDEETEERKDECEAGRAPAQPNYWNLETPSGETEQRATGADACYPAYGRIPSGIGGSRITPAGFLPNMNRGHLIAYSLSGSNKELRNMVPLYRQANYPEMYTQHENRVRPMVNAGETVYYQVVPYYTVNAFIPCAVIITIYNATTGVVDRQPLINQGLLNGNWESGCR